MPRKSQDPTYTEPRTADTYDEDMQAAEPVQEKKKRGKPRKEKAPKQPRQPKAQREYRRSFGDVMRSRVTVGVICVTAALLIGFVAFPASQAMAARRVPVVVAAVDVEAGTLLTADMLQATEIGEIDRPANAAHETSQAVESWTTRDLMAGDVVTSAKLSRERPLQNAYLYDLPADKVAISVNVKGLAEGLSAKLKAGDIVSVYAVFNKSDAENDYVSLQPPELKYVEVLAVSNATGADIDVDAPPVTEDAEKEWMPATITLSVGDYQAAALAGLDLNATIHVGLVARATDAERCVELLASQDEYIREVEAELAEENGDATVRYTVTPPSPEDGAMATEGVDGAEQQPATDMEGEVNGAADGAAPANG